MWISKTEAQRQGSLRGMVFQQALVVSKNTGRRPRCLFTESQLFFLIINQWAKMRGARSDKEEGT